MPSLKLGAGAAFCAFCIGVGCSAGGGGVDHEVGAGGKSSAAAQGNAAAGTGGALFRSGATGSAGGSADGGRPPRCDDAGKCTCINIASLGKPAHYGAGNDNTDAFQAWLNSKSSASIDLLTAQTTLTPAFLSNYDVIILQALEDGENGPFWQFTPAEQSALSDWVKAGGGLIALTGYGGDADEVDPTNALLSFANISYDKDDILGTCPNGEPCYCWGNSVPLTGWQANSPFSANITEVGAFHGRSIVSADGSVVATDGTTKLAVSKQVGKGNVFAFCDEWVTYTSQWLGSGVDPGMNDPCYQKSADQIFQVPQFWYNVIKGVSPNAACFDISDPAIIK